MWLLTITKEFTYS